MDSNIFSDKKATLSRLFLDGFIKTIRCHETLFKSDMDDNDQQKQMNLMCSFAYLTEAHTLFTTAGIFLKENEEILGSHQELDELLHQFSVFNKEVLDSVRTNHSHQWSDIEFKALIKNFETVALLLNIENADYFIGLANK